MRVAVMGLLMTLLLTGRAGAQRFTPEVEGTPAGEQMELALTDVKAGRAADGLARVSSLLSQSGARVGNNESAVATQIALARWAEDFRRELERAEGDAAGKALAGLRANTEADPVEFVRLAHSVVSRVVVAEALGEAAERLARLGDFAGSRALYRRAIAAGWRGQEVSGLPEVQAQLPVPVMAEYWWWGKSPDRLGGTRSMVLAGAAGQDQLFITSATHVLSLRDGKVAWGFPAVPAPGPTLRPTKENPGRLDFPVYGSVLSSGVLVARTASAAGGRVGGLTAFRARDGKVLWSTQESRLHIASMPAVSGRYVYAVAAEMEGSGEAGGAGAGLNLLGLDLMTGRELFRARLGALSQPVMAGRRMSAPELWDEMTAPAVSDDAAYVACGGGVWMFDRFDGAFLRSATYRVQAAVAREGNLPSEQPMSRWTATPVLTEKLVIVATRDAEPVLGLDRETLEPRWETRNLGNYTLFAASGTHAFLQGPEIVACELATGRRSFLIAPRAGGAFTGPAALWGAWLVAPTGKGPAAFSAGNGEFVKDGPGKLPALRSWVSGETAGILRAADALRAFYRASEIENLANPR